MGNLKTGNYEGVTWAMAPVSLWGARLNVCVYLVDGLLVDTGPGRFAAEFGSFFKSQSIKQAVITHYHEDHSGNARRLERQGVPVYIHPSSIPICEKKAELPMYRRYFWGRREAFSPLPLPDVLETENVRWQVVETPGHCFDHIALFNPATGAVFTGDLVVTPKTKLVMKTENIPQIMDSLRRLLGYDFGVVYCGHAGPVANGRELVRAKLDYLENLSGQARELHQRGWSLRAINKKIFPGMVPLTVLSGGEWASAHMIRSLIEDDDYSKKDR
ncbi:MAG: MBL fold metallo-hydrolase [Firmicutes bacterium]|nr:MBL fold metallo-hydrolase [Bacillota bacterium]